MIRSLEGLYHLLEAILANLWFRFPGNKLTVIGVTGTDGKTTTTTLIYEILKSAGKRASMITSVHAVIGGKVYDTGFHVTTPRAWSVQRYLRQAVDHGDTMMVLEVTSHALAQHRVWGIPFSVGVITNVTHEHLDWHGTFAAYLRTKLNIIKNAQVAILPHDDEAVFNEAKALTAAKTVFTFGTTSGSDFSRASYTFQTKLPGKFNELNCLAAIAATKVLEISDDVIQKTLSSFAGVPGRMEVVATKPFTVIVDFAHTPNAIEHVLQTVKKTTKKRLIHVFGSAALRDHEKRPMMGAASARYADAIILTEEDYRTEDVNEIIEQIAGGIPKDHEVHKIPDRKKAIEFAVSLCKPGDTLILTGKGHEKSLARGNKEYPWSDQEAVFKSL